MNSPESNLPPAARLSVVAPAYNEERVLQAFFGRIVSVLNPLDMPYEVILVDDGSSDRTWDIIEKQCLASPAFKGIRFSRNFGQQCALSAGIDAATGDAVVTMDSDLQHPPEEIPRMIEAWRNGAEVVNMARDATEKIPFIKKIGTALFYWFMNRVSDTPLGHDMPDFRLMDRRVADRFRRLGERGRFIRGLVSWLGFAATVLHFRAPSAPSGKTRYGIRKMALLAFDALTSFTAFPLRVALFIGLAVSALGGLYCAYVLYTALVLHAVVPGWSSLMSVVLFLGGCQMVFLGIIGEYLSRVFTEVKQRPLYVEKSRLNLPAPRIR
jgi:polyisoprenyl-phosphate glycosyltransferase